MNFLSCPDSDAYQSLVWAFVRQIPSGNVVTYGQIMKALPCPHGISPEEYQLSASRWVGAAMAACPDDVPWHRVVNAQGKISHMSSANEQKQRLIGEGVLFIKNRIDLAQCQWLGAGQNEQPLPVQGQLF